MLVEVRLAWATMVTCLQPQLNASEKIHTIVYLHKSMLNDRTHNEYVVHSMRFWAQHESQVAMVTGPLCARGDTSTHIHIH